MNISNADEQMQDEAYAYMADRSKPGPILIFSFFLLFIYISPIYHDQPFEIIIIGLSLAIISCIRIYNEFSFNRTYFLNKERWKKTYLLTISVNAFIWGIFCLIVVREYGIHWISLLILICTAGFSAGGIIAVIPHQKLSFSFQAFILLPTALYSFTLNEAAAYSISYMFLSYLIFMTIMSKKLHLEYWTSVKNVRLLDQRAKELEISRDEALELADIKSKFLATMSHELRTPMNGILGMSQLLELSKLDKEQTDYVSTIRNSTNSLLTIINNILDYSKANSDEMSLNPQHFNMPDFIDSIYKLLKPTTDNKNLSLNIDIPKNEAMEFIGDEGRIRQVIMNLLGNAIKFTNKGSITLKLEFSDLDHAKKIRFNIIDTGIGINTSDQKKIFSEFTQADASSTRKYGGTGLGLAISKKIVALMDGEIGVTSQENTGSTFWFEILLPTVGCTNAPSGDQQNSEPSNFVLDKKIIAQLKETMEDQFPQLVKKYVETLEKNLAHIKTCIDQSDNGNLSLYLQSLSSSSATIGASSLDAEAKYKEQKLVNENKSLTKSDYDKLERMAKKVKQALSSQID